MCSVSVLTVRSIDLDSSVIVACSSDGVTVKCEVRRMPSHLNIAGIHANFIECVYNSVVHFAALPNVIRLICQYSAFGSPLYDEVVPSRLIVLVRINRIRIIRNVVPLHLPLISNVDVIAIEQCIQRDSIAKLSSNVVSVFGSDNLQGYKLLRFGFRSFGRLRVFSRFYCFLGVGVFRFCFLRFFGVIVRGRLAGYGFILTRRVGRCSGFRRTTGFLIAFVIGNGSNGVAGVYGVVCQDFFRRRKHTRRFFCKRYKVRSNNRKNHICCQKHRSKLLQHLSHIVILSLHKHLLCSFLSLCVFNSTQFARLHKYFLRFYCFQML